MSFVLVATGCTLHQEALVEDEAVEVVEVVDTSEAAEASEFLFYAPSNGCPRRPKRSGVLSATVGI